MQQGRRKGRERGKVGQGPLPGEATWQCLQHNLNNSDAICHTLYGIPCHTTGHTLSYHVPYHEPYYKPYYIWSRLANRSAAQLKGSNSHSNFAISAGSTCLTFFASFSFTTPRPSPCTTLSLLYCYTLSIVYTIYFASFSIVFPTACGKIFAK